MRGVAVRPYARQIRARVFSLLTTTGVRVDDADVVEAGTPDREVLESLGERRCDVLVVPFHAHNDRDGNAVHGLDVIARVRAELPLHRSTPIICPISNVGLAAAGLMLSRMGEEALGPILFLHEDELDDAGITSLVEAFVEEIDPRYGTPPG